MTEQLLLCLIATLIGIFMIVVGIEIKKLTTLIGYLGVKLNKIHEIVQINSDWEELKQAAKKEGESLKTIAHDLQQIKTRQTWSRKREKTMAKGVKKNV